MKNKTRIRGAFLATVIAAGLASVHLRAGADQDTGMTCNFVGADDPRPGETVLDQRERLDRKRAHWRKRYEENDRAYRAILHSTSIPDWEWGSRVKALLAEGDTFRFYEKNCEEKMDELERQKTILLWTAKKGHKPRILTLTDFMSIPGSASMGFTDTQTAFENDGAFEDWAARKGSSLLTRAKYYSSRRPLLKSCVTRLNEGASARVELHRTSTLCERRFGPDATIGDASAYRLRNSGGVIEIDHAVSFKYDGNSKNRESSLRRIKNAIPCIERFYAGQGIRLSLRFHTDPSLHEFYRDSDALVSLSDSNDRTYSNEWAAWISGKRNLTENELCGTSAHEIGHQLGLPDLYPEPDRCPDRVVGDDGNNLMYHGNFYIDAANIDDSQLKSMTAPLCR